MQTRHVRVLVADDHAVFRLGLRELLASHEEIEVVGEAATGEEALAKARETHPDVAVLDVRMPQMNGIEATKRLKEEMPALGVVVMSAVDTDAEIFEAIEAGANGYILKDEDPHTLLDAIDSASHGGAYLPPSIARRVMQRVVESRSPSAGSGRGSRPAAATLTERETTILRLLAQGKRNRETAQLLGISERTVGNHIVNIYNKLHIKDRAQAIVYAVQKGLITI